MSCKNASFRHSCVICTKKIEEEKSGSCKNLDRYNIKRGKCSAGWATSKEHGLAGKNLEN